MKKWILAAAILGTVSLQTAGATAINITSVNGAVIDFNGASGFTFDDSTTAPVSGFDFQVSSGSANGLFGNLSGAFTIGAITVSGPLQSANVTGNGTLAIYDGANTFSANVTWGELSTIFTGGLINDTAAVNLTNVVYGGSNADLMALAAGGSDVGTVSFTFTDTSHTLTELSGTKTTDSYSGQVSSSAVPEPMTFSLMGAGLLGLGLLRKRITK